MIKYTLFVFLLLLAFISKAQMYPQVEGEIIEHRFYTLCYQENYEQAAWVMYMLKPTMIKDKVAKRSDNFRQDTLVSTGSAYPVDYRKSGYDRGHLCPAGDMGFDSVAMSETFFMSNMSPQLPSFNRGIWRYAEEQVRKWVLQCDSILVITGPLFCSDSLHSIGENAVAIADYFYKALLFYNDNEMQTIAFLMPHKDGLKGHLKYILSIDNLELFSGYDFFSDINNEVENKIENRVFRGW